MSRSLPAQASLEHLKKQAKQLLRVMRQNSAPETRLADAQHALAKDYGFPSWAKLKSFVEAQPRSPFEAFKDAVCASEPGTVRTLLERYPELRTKINDPLPDYGFGTHAMFAAVQRSDRETIDVLLAAGADINKRTEWWAGSFGILDDCAPEMLDFLLSRGARLDVHSAARLGLFDQLRELVAAEPALVHARGGDGQTPLHFAANVEIAEFLVAHGADIDARDIDHESTPAQYMLRIEQKRHYTYNRQPVARYLVSRGCRTDLLMASALGDLDLARRLLDSDPECIRITVSDEWFPKQNPQAGGTIYIWQLGNHRTAHSVARDFGHEELYRFLLTRTPDDLKLAIACELGDEASFRSFLAAHPHAAGSLSESALRKLPDAAQSNNTQAVRLLLEAGWPVDTRGDSGATALHWAGFNGNAAMTREILRFHPSLEIKSTEYEGTALSWATYGSANGWHTDDGDHPGAVRALLAAGAIIPPHADKLEPTEAVLQILKNHKTEAGA